MAVYIKGTKMGTKKLKIGKSNAYHRVTNIQWNSNIWVAWMGLIFYDYHDFQICQGGL